MRGEKNVSSRVDPGKYVGSKEEAVRRGGGPVEGGYFFGGGR